MHHIYYEEKELSFPVYQSKQSIYPSIHPASHPTTHPSHGDELNDTMNMQKRRSYISDAFSADILIDWSRSSKSTLTIHGHAQCVVLFDAR